MKILVHIVTWNSAEAYLKRTVSSIRAQDFSGDVKIEITDNGSSDGTAAQLDELAAKDAKLEIFKNVENLGFCGAHNQGVARFLSGSYEFFLVLNPDAFLLPSLLTTLVESFNRNKKIGAATPKLLRCAPDGTITVPAVIDAGGMCLTSSLRHFDRGSGEADRGQLDHEELVFGGTGACLLLHRDCVKDLIIDDGVEDSAALYAVFPQLSKKPELRRHLFDEAFFAFREDADLAWRMQILGWGCLYVPSAVAYHVRRVTPERRERLSPEINRHSVRNRFLLQLNNLPGFPSLPIIVFGMILRNLIVICGVLVKERTSLAAFRELSTLSARALRRRQRLAQRPLADFRRGACWARTKAE